ncbi:MAG: phosphatase PAP2 family protein [Pirellulales bacterium]|nr:phosphatase PAP2 family protein [Pirellulales bacterium]
MPLTLRPKRLASEPVLLTLIMLSSALSWGFFRTAETMRSGAAGEFDRRVVLALRTPGDPADPLGPAWVEEMMRDFTALGGIAVVSLVSVVAVTFLWLVKRRWEAGFVALAILGAIGFSLALKNAFDRPRPELVPHGSHVYTASFPSGHAMMAACVYLTIAATLARFTSRGVIKAFLLSTATLATVAVGASRVYLGVHWPTDVLAGWTAGAAWALACWMLERLLRPKRAASETPAARA